VSKVNKAGVAVLEYPRRSYDRWMRFGPTIRSLLSFFHSSTLPRPGKMPVTYAHPNTYNIYTLLICVFERTAPLVCYSVTVKILSNVNVSATKGPSGHSCDLACSSSVTCRVKFITNLYLR
jgi:hypothetical protein